MNEPIPIDKIKERIILLKRFLSSIEWDSELKNKALNLLGLPQNYNIKIEELARNITDSQLESLFQLSPFKKYCIFRGKYYTVKKDGTFEFRSSREEVKNNVKQVLTIHGKKGYALLKALTEVEEAPFDTIVQKACEIYGERYYPSRLIAELRDVWDLAWEVGSRGILDGLCLKKLSLLLKKF